MTTTKELASKAVKIKWKDYIQVKDRVQYLSDNYDWRYSLQSEYQYFEARKMWVVKATLTIWDEQHKEFSIYNWLAQEVESEDYKQVNFSSALENAETSAWGRACAAAWIWIDVTWGIASANEMEKAMNRSKTVSKVVDETPAVEKKENPNWWFKKACESKKFMESCLDEDDFINKIKNKYEVWEVEESQLREAYKNHMWIDDWPVELPFE